MTCPTCGRRPSERTHPTEDVLGHNEDGTFKYAECTDPIHDLADAAPAMYEALQSARQVFALIGDSALTTQQYSALAAAIAAATGEEVTS